MSGADNPGFVASDDAGLPPTNQTDTKPPPSALDNKLEKPPAVEREKWDKGVEFLMSCIALSVGLGNVWKFPSTAFRNGGGAFVIPYLIVLLVVGRPIYYLEMVMGQFSSRGSVKVYDVSPIMRGKKLRVCGYVCESVLRD
uniref:Sodium-dependent nutrient amino acid transporter 1 n=1 Tax=Anopheles maculatus TaxID=74869 RepID=A0A182SRE6_9DIPT